MEQIELLPTLAGGLGIALLLGYAAHRTGLSPIIGYLLAGFVVGPQSPGFVANIEYANQLAELGVVLLMFGVGLHFDLHELARVRRLAVPGALLQSLCSVAVGFGLASSYGWSVEAALAFGLAVAFASTVVVTRTLADSHALQSQVGHVAMGWLIVQDLLAVLALVLLPSVSTGESFELQRLFEVFSIAAVKIGALIILVTFVGAKLIPSILQHVAETRSRELFTLSVLVVALGIALLSANFFGVSMALGAFLAGVVVGQSEFSLRAATEALPMRDAFAVLFFVSVGMLFDPLVLWNSLDLVCKTLLLVMVFTPLISLLLILILGYPLRLALSVALSLGQIGEFSFILANLGLRLNILSAEAMDVLVAVAMISICLSPLTQLGVNPLARTISRLPGCRSLMAMRRAFSLSPAVHDDSQPETPLEGFRTVIIGFGPVGQTVARLLAENGIEPTIIEMNHLNISQIREAGFRAVLGDAHHIETLKHAGVENSESLILSASSIPGATELIRVARDLNPKIKIIARTSYLRERETLTRCGADTVFAGEGEVALALAEFILRDLGATPEQMDREREKLRAGLLAGEIRTGGPSPL